MSAWAVLPLVQLGVFLATMAVGLRQVLASISELKTQSGNDSTEAIRRRTSKVFVVHHGGLALAFVIGVLQVAQVV